MPAAAGSRVTAAPATLVMGVLNVTPDSFSDGGEFNEPEAAIARGLNLISQGAHIIDIGGESTRPGASLVDAEEEQQRVLPVVTALSAAGVCLSVDTLHAATAAAVITAGAHFVNDVSGGTYDEGMFDAVAYGAKRHGTQLIIGHWRGIPDPRELRSDYTDVVSEVADSLAQQRDAAVRAGVPREQIVLDPGLGFDKTAQQCWQLLARLDEVQALGHRVLIGASRKRMLAELLEQLPGAADHRSPSDRDLVTAVVSALAARAGAWGVRVHDVVGTTQAIAVNTAWKTGMRHGSLGGATPATHSGSSDDHLHTDAAATTAAAHARRESRGTA